MLLVVDDSVGGGDAARHAAVGLHIFDVALDHHVHDQRLVADGLPPVDVVGGLEHVVAGADGAAVAQAARALQGQRVHFAAVAGAAAAAPRVGGAPLPPPRAA